MNPSTLLAVLQLFSVCFCHFRSLVIVIPRSRCSSVAISCPMTKWNSLDDVFKVNVSFSMFKSKVRNLYLQKYYKEILMLGGTMIAFFSDMHASTVFEV